MIEDIANESGISVLVACCLDHKPLEDGSYEYSLAGTHTLEPQNDPPSNLVLAAQVLGLPGFGPYMGVDEQKDSNDDPE